MFSDDYYDDDFYADDYDDDYYGDDYTSLSDIVDVRSQATAGDSIVNSRINFSRKKREANSIQCPSGQVKECAVGKASASTATSTPAPKTNEVCVDYDVRYNGGGQLDKIDNVVSADACRARDDGALHIILF
jgi:hypothetical protein